jgi:hypothetical protein
MSTVNLATIQSNTALPPTIQNSSAVEIGTFCRAWVNFNGTGTVAIRASFNVSSITDGGTGDYTVNFTTAMPDANYSPVSIGTTDATTYTANVQIKNSSALTTGSVRIDCYEYNNAATKRDPVYVLLSIFR